MSVGEAMNKSDLKDFVRDIRRLLTDGRSSFTKKELESPVTLRQLIDVLIQYEMNMHKKPKYIYVDGFGYIYREDGTLLCEGDKIRRDIARDYERQYPPDVRRWLKSVNDILGDFKEVK